MAKPNIPNQKKAYNDLRLRIDKYTLLIEDIYNAYNLEASKIALSTPFSEGVFRFSDFPLTKDKVEKMLEKWREDMTGAIKTTTSQEWKKSNEFQDLLADGAMKYYYGSANGKRKRKYYQTNSDAYQAFIERKDKGMNLSKKIWVQSQDYKEELEAAISTGIQKGMSAVTLSKKVSKYLIDYPLLQKEYKEKFGKATTAKNCEYRSIRLARSEINIAYREAEQKRWSQFDFVVGKEIKISKVHFHRMPMGDLCDELQGKYPKDFPWNGWHPNCFCYEIPILKDEDEFFELEENEAGKNAVKDVPNVFVDWVDRNKDRILRAEERNTLPYFIRDNYNTVKGIITPNPVLSTLEKARLRHAARTKEQIQEIQDRWDERKKEYRIANNMANNILSISNEYPEVNVDNLKKYIDNYDISSMREESRRVAKQIVDIKKREKAITDLIPDAHAWIKQFSIAELEKAHSSIKNTLQRWDWNFDSMDNLKKIQGALKYEVGWMETKGKKYATWQVSRDAYKKKLELVEHRIRMLEVKDDIASQLQFVAGSKSKPANLLVQEFNDLFSVDNTDIAVLKNKAEEIKKKVHQLEVSKALRERKKVSTAFVPKTDEATKKDFIDWVRPKGISIQERDVVVDNGFIHLQSDQHQKIYEALKPETDAERTQLWNRVLKTQRTWRGGYVRTSNSFNINGDFRKTGVTGVIDKAAEAKLRANGMTADDIKTCKLLDKKISKFSLPVPIRVTRYVEPEALPNIFGEAIDVYEGSRFSERKTLDSIIKSKKEIRPDPAYLSASTNENQNVFTHFDIKLEIEVPPNTPFYLTNNYIESEVVFGRSTKLQFISAKNQGGYVVVRARMIQ